MTNAEQSREDLQNASHESRFVQEEDDGHITFMTVQCKTKGTMQSSSVSSDFTSKLLNLDNTGPNVSEIASLMNTSTVPPSPPLVNPSSHLTTTPPQQTPESKTTTTNPTTTFLEIPNFSSLFWFKQRVSVLEIKVSEFNQISQFVEAVSSVPDIVDQYLASKMKEAVDVAVRLQSNKLKEEAKAVNQEFFNQVDSTMKAIIKEQVKAQVSKIMPQIEKYAIESLGAEVLDQRNEYGHLDDQLDNEAAPKHDWFQTHDKPPTPDRAWNKSKSIDSRPPQKWISTIAKARQPPRPAFNLLKGSCKSFSELEYHFEECYKAVNDRLDWHNPEGREYLFDLSKPLPLIEDRGRQVVPTDYFINNDLEYLKGGSSSSKYVTFTTRTKAAKYDNIKGIEDMVQTLWSPVKVAYNKHVVWGTYHQGPKRQRFYAYACHWKSPHDVYSKRRIIAVTSVKVMRWYDYGYLEEIVIRRDDNVIYKFKEGDFPRLNLCDIEDMLLLLVQKKLSNLDVDDRYDLGVALRMFTRQIIILHRVQDLQLGVESYQKKLNITRPETTKSNISKLTPYTTYKNLEGIIYQYKYKRNKLMRSDKLYKFCDGTLSFVRYRIMVKVIDKLLFERRLMRNLEKFVCRRNYGNDLRLLERTI
ncbi:hypothetical protein Tco_0058203 [Tanacetum coccineum]